MKFRVLSVVSGRSHSFPQPSRFLACVLAGSLWLPSLASATILATNSFEGFTTGALNGQGGGAVDGWAGNWDPSITNPRAEVVDTTANPLSFTPAGGVPIDGATRALEVALTGGATSQICARRQPSTPIAETIYAGYVVRYVGSGVWASANNTFTLHLGTNASSVASLNFGLRGDNNAANSEFVVRYNTGGSDPRVAIGGQLANNTTYYLVVKMEWNGTAAYTNALMWLNPTVTDDVDTPAGDASLAFSCGPITHIFFREAVLEADDILQADEIKIGTMWADVVPPGGMAARLLRELKPGEAAREARGSSDKAFTIDAQIVLSGSARAAPNTGIRWNGGVMPPLTIEQRLARVAAHYVLAHQAGSRHQNHDVALKLGIGDKKVTEDLRAARRKGILMQTSRGQSGGEMTSKGDEVLLQMLEERVPAMEAALQRAASDAVGMVEHLGLEGANAEAEERSQLLAHMQRYLAMLLIDWPTISMDGPGRVGLSWKA